MSRNPEDEEADVLQAVILADSFNKRFKPLTADRPKVHALPTLCVAFPESLCQCLLPICNAPLLDWTLEGLALAGIQEIFVICRSHAEQVKVAIQ
jgi:translation initiation factor eIF-2B subunit epsilon